MISPSQGAAASWKAGLGAAPPPSHLRAGGSVGSREPCPSVPSAISGAPLLTSSWRERFKPGYLCPDTLLGRLVQNLTPGRARKPSSSPSKIIHGFVPSWHDFQLFITFSYLLSPFSAASEMFMSALRLWLGQPSLQ